MAQAGELLVSGASALPAAKEVGEDSLGPKQVPLPQIPVPVLPQLVQSASFAATQAPSWQMEMVQSVEFASQEVPFGSQTGTQVPASQFWAVHVDASASQELPFTW